MSAKSLCFKDKVGLKRWISQFTDPFSSKQAPFVFSETESSQFVDWWQDLWVKAAPENYVELRAANHVPIEVFRWHQKAILSLDWHRSFQSSGTTQSERSQSPFSQRGLEAYAVGSMLTFYHVLRRFFPDPFAVRGVSLIPTAADWPGSSLAQMMSWCAELWPVDYVGNYEWTTAISTSVQRAEGDEPVWLFGTAFDFVNACDSGVKFNLPSGSVVIETGGTKGKSRSVTRDELYQLIEHHFGISKAHIISEYGMCELASQAYDAAPLCPDGQRGFRFPGWVTISTQQADNKFYDNGFGAVTINDPLRCDIRFAIRTQDLAELRPDRSFVLAGRVPSSVLKGCSLRVEDYFADRTTGAMLPASRSDVELTDDFALVSHLKHWLLSDSTKNAFAARLGGEFYAQQALRGIINALPKSPLELSQLVASSKAAAKTWLFIGPQTHPVAIIEPILLLLAAKGRAVIRIPTQCENGVEQLMVEHMAQLVGDRICSVPPTFRIGTTQLPSYVDGILAFCDSATAEIIRQHASRPVSIYGEALAFGFFPTLALASLHAQEILLQTLSLGQQGCLSLRALWINESFEKETWIEFVTALRSAIPAKLPIDPSLAIAQNHELWRYSWLKPAAKIAFVHNESFRLLLPVIKRVDFSSPFLHQNLSGCRHTLPCFFSDVSDLKRSIEKAFPTWSFTLSSLTMEGQASQDLNHGDFGFPTWLGVHQNRPYFIAEGMP